MSTQGLREKLLQSTSQLYTTSRASPSAQSPWVRLTRKNPLNMRTWGSVAKPSTRGICWPCALGCHKIRLIHATYGQSTYSDLLKEFLLLEHSLLILSCQLYTSYYLTLNTTRLAWNSLRSKGQATKRCEYEPEDNCPSNGCAGKTFKPSILSPWHIDGQDLRGEEIYIMQPK